MGGDTARSTASIDRGMIGIALDCGRGAPRGLYCCKLSKAGSTARVRTGQGGTARHWSRRSVVMWHPLIHPRVSFELKTSRFYRYS
jgi:hypothetical protein